MLWFTSEIKRVEKSRIFPDEDSPAVFRNKQRAWRVIMLQETGSESQMRVVQTILIAGFLCAAGYLAWVYGSRHTASTKLEDAARRAQAARNEQFLKNYGGKVVRILQFYASEGELTEGSPVSICYTVINARAIRIEPPLPRVGVAFNRCVEDRPEKTTRYTLTAEGIDGSAVSESFVVRAKADPRTLPLIRRFGIVRSYDDPLRKVYSLSFETANAAEVSIEPPVFPVLQGASHGQFYVEPLRTTTYTLRAVDKTGRAVEQKLTIEVPTG